MGIANEATPSFPEIKDETAAESSRDRLGVTGVRSPALCSETAKLDKRSAPNWSHRSLEWFGVEGTLKPILGTPSKWLQALPELL